VELDPGRPVIMGDGIQLEQIVTNLLMNAIEAMAERHDGRRTAQSNDGQGAMFHVLLPAETGDSP